MGAGKGVFEINSLSANWSIFLYNRIIGSWPNTYTFTKALAEHVVAEVSNDFPVTIVRPSISKYSLRLGWDILYPHSNT